MANHTTRAQRINARQDKIWERCLAAKKTKTMSNEQRLREALQYILSHLESTDGRQTWICGDALHPLDDDKTVVDYLRETLEVTEKKQGKGDTEDDLRGFVVSVGEYLENNIPTTSEGDDLLDETYEILEKRYKISVPLMQAKTEKRQPRRIETEDMPVVGCPSFP